MLSASGARIAGALLVASFQLSACARGSDDLGVQDDALAAGFVRAYGTAGDDRLIRALPREDGGAFLVLVGDDASTRVVATDAAGTIAWQRRVGLEATSAVVRDGLLVVLGRGRIIELDRDGAVRVDRAYRANGRGTIRSVRARRDGRLLLTGTATTVAPLGDQDFGYVASVGNGGDVEWTRAFAPAGDLPAELAIVDVVEGARTLFAVGTSAVEPEQREVPASGPAGLFVVTLDERGTVARQERLQGDSDTSVVRAAATSDGGMVVVASTGAFGARDLDVLVVKLDARGARTFEVALDGGLDERPVDVVELGDGSIAVLATRGVGLDADAWVVRLDARGRAVGDVLYRLAGDDAASSLERDGDGLLVGLTTRAYGTGGSDALVLRVDSAGAPPVGSPIDVRTGLARDRGVRSTRADLERTARYELGRVDAAPTTITEGDVTSAAIGGPPTSVIEGGDGDDRLLGTSGDDVLAGGRGDDDLEGGAGDDVYELRRGDGVDYVLEEGGEDTVRFVDRTFGELAIRRSGRHLWIDADEDSVSVRGHFSRADWAVEWIEAGGARRSVNELLEGGGELRGTSGADVIVGTSGADVIEGLAGDDRLIGQEGDDTFVVRRGDGRDVIDDSSARAIAGIDTLDLRDSSASEVRLEGGSWTWTEGEEEHLRLEVDVVLPAGQRIRIQSYERITADRTTQRGAGEATRVIERIRFRDGSSWDEREIGSRIVWTARRGRPT